MLIYLWSFEQNPTYEDMVAFANAIGHEKPPTASAEAVASSNGIYQVRTSHNDGTVEAFSVDNPLSTLRMAGSNACIVCFEDFQVNQELRRILNCEHIFHRICVDQVSTDLFSFQVEHCLTLYSSGLPNHATLALYAEALVWKRSPQMPMSLRLVTMLGTLAEQSKLKSTFGI